VQSDYPSLYLPPDFDLIHFFETYGDCYISGYTEGGHFLGIIDINGIDIAEFSGIKQEIESRF
jgi:hypothetical protein